MGDLTPQIKKRRGIGVVLLAVWLVAILVQVQPAGAAVGGRSCAGEDPARIHHPKALCCNDSAASSCDCDLRPSGPLEKTAPPLASSSNLPNPLDKNNVALSKDITALPSTGLQHVDDAGSTLRGPTLKIYLQTHNLLI